MNSLNDLHKSIAIIALDNVLSRDGACNIDSFMEEYTKLIVKQCSYYAEIFVGLGCPIDKRQPDYGVGDFILDAFEED